MFSLSHALVAGAALIASVNAGDNFIQSQVRTLSITRVDPLTAPGANGPHVHNVVGGSAFGPDSTTPDSLQNSQCTSTMIGDDKSIYWAPQVYYNMGNGSYTPIFGSTRIYYFLKPLNGTTPVKAFPRGHRMLAGPPSDTRPATYPPRGELSYDQQQAMDPRVNAIKWGCSAGAVQGEGDGGSLPGQRPYLPNDAPNGCGVLNQGIFYPSCSDGRLDSDDHFSHMAYPLDGPEGYNCPASHSIKYPTIFMENFYFMNAQQQYRGANTDNWVLSNGDTLGLSMHADFINGWVDGALENILNSCNAPNAPGDDLNSCAAIAKSVSVDNADNCRSQGNIVDEDVGLLAPINALPGCNPIWPVDARTKPTCKGSQLAMVQPTSRLNIPDLKLGLPVAGGTSKVVSAPSGANNSYSYSYTSTSTSSYASTSSATTTSLTSTSSLAATSTTSSASSSSAAAATSTTGAATSSSSSSSTSAAPTTSSSAAPNEYYGSSSSTSTSTSTSDAYVYPGSSSSSAPAAGAAASTSASQSSSTSVAAAAAATSPASTSSAATSTATTSSASTSTASTSTASTSAAAAAGAPGAGHATSSTHPVANATNAPHSSSTNTMHMNPSTSKAATSTASASTSSPTPQNANAVGGRPPKKTCAHRKHHNHNRRRRDWKKGMLN